METRGSLRRGFKIRVNLAHFVLEKEFTTIRRRNIFVRKESHFCFALPAKQNRKREYGEYIKNPLHRPILSKSEKIIANLDGTSS